MTARESILQKIRAVQIEKLPEPEVPAFMTDAADESLFRQTLSMAGARVTEVDKEKVSDFVNGLFPSCRILVSDDISMDGVERVSDLKSPVESEMFTAGVIRADFGVEENGALWISRAGLKVPVFPFIAEHLVVLLERGALCSNMHEAYKRISFREFPFGLFIAGPSKTADIEQSLVIGAHGPLSLTVVIVC